MKTFLRDAAVGVIQTIMAGVLMVLAYGSVFAVILFLHYLMVRK